MFVAEMKYLSCVGLCILWLICHVQLGIFALHVQQAPEIIQRITRQATRYGSAGTVSGQTNYQPSSSSFNVRNVASDLSTGLKTSQLNSLSSNAGQRPVGVGAYSFGGMASGRPTNGNSFAIGNSAKGTGLRNGPQAISGHTIIGSGSVAGSTIGRPQHLQQALLQAAQYQLQQQQQPQQYQQQQQLRRQLSAQQLYRQRPATAYQQYN